MNLKIRRTLSEAYLPMCGRAARSAETNELRVGRACELLAEPDRNITLSDLDCGFNNLSNFNRNFLQLRRVPPREYRRRVQD